MVKKSLFRSYTLETQTVAVQTFLREGGVFFLIFIEQFKHKLFSVWYKPQHVKLLRRKQTRWLHRWKTWTILAFGVCLSAPFSQSVQTLGENIQIRWLFFIFFFFYLHRMHSNTNYFSSCTTKASVCETTQTKTNTLTPKLSILYLTGFCSLLGICLSAPFIYIGYNLFTNSTSGNRKNAKLLKDKQFELRKVTGAVVAYSSPVNKQVEISLFCTQHLIGWIWKCCNLLFQIFPCDWFTLSGWPRFQ